MSLTKMAAALAACLLVLLANLPAQDQKPEQKTEQTDQGFRIGVTVNQVSLALSARYLTGGFVTDLKKEDITVVEDGVAQEITNFSSEYVPVHVVFLVDTSGSIESELPAIRRAGMKFVKSLTAQDRVAIVTFNADTRLILNWTPATDHPKIENALLRLYAKGRTVFYDALYVTFGDLLKDVGQKKAVIALTDGMDTGSMIGFSEAMAQGNKSDAMVYVVSKLEQYWASAIQIRMEYEKRGEFVPPDLKDGRILEVSRELERMARNTGGTVLSARDMALGEIYERVAEEIKNQYYVAYLPHNMVRDGRWREVELRSRRLDVSLRTREGYFAPEK